MRRKVLVVEDQELWWDLIKSDLESEGYFVKVAQGLDEAFAILERERFHFATVDLQLDEDDEPEEFTGWDVLERINQTGNNRTMGIMVVTSYPGDTPDSNKLIASERFKVYHFMEKHNYSKEKLLRVIARHIELYDVRFYDEGE